MLKGNFDLNDFLEQVFVLEQIGPLTKIAEKIPGVAEALANGADSDDEQFGRIIAMISSMTEDERRHPERFVVTTWEMIVEGSKAEKQQHDIVYDAAFDMRRLRRVAQGSGRTVHEVIDLLHQFSILQQLMLQIGRSTDPFG